MHGGISARHGTAAEKRRCGILDARPGAAHYQGTIMAQINLHAVA